MPIQDSKRISFILTLQNLYNTPISNLKLIATILIVFGYISLCQFQLSAQEVKSDVIAPPPVFSETSGFFDENITLSLSHPLPNAIILYTLDGSEPNLNNLEGTTYQYKNQYPQNPGQPEGEFLENEYKTYEYTAPIELQDRSNEPNKLALISSTKTFTAQYMPTKPIRKANVVRSRAVVNGIPGPIESHTYFISSENKFTSNLPILSFNLDEDAFFDYYEGIYVAGVDFDKWRQENPNQGFWFTNPSNYQRRGRETEKDINFQWFENNSLKLNQNVGVRIHGGASRSRSVKSLRLYARNAYDKNNSIDIPVFGMDNGNSFKRLLLRNSGQDAYLTFFRDAFSQTLVKHLNFDTQDYQPAIHYINGEYWGLINIRERYDKHYFERVYNIDEDELDFLDASGLSPSNIKEGNNDHWIDLYNTIEDNNLSDPEIYSHVTTLMDEKNFIDYNLANIYFVNTDWPGNNIAFFRKQTAEYDASAPYGQDGRWRWVLYDTDYGFGYFNESGAQSYEHNTLEFATEPNGPNWPNPQWSTLFLRKLLENEEFRNQFINRYADLLNTAFLPEQVLQTMEHLKLEIVDEIPFMQERWNRYENWEQEVAVMENFGIHRPKYAKQHLKDFFNLAEDRTITLDVNDYEQGYIQINRTPINTTTPGVDVEPYPWEGIYFEEVPVTLTAVAYPGYTFSHWSGYSNTTEETIELNLTQDTNITAHYEPTEKDVVLHYWMMDTDMLNNTPLEELAPTYSVYNSTANLKYTSSLDGYPFDSSNPNWRKASMERRNRPTQINYFPEYNDMLLYEQANMRGLQVRQPFQTNSLENSLTFEIEASNYEITQLSFAAKDEGAAEALIIEYYDETTNSWTTDNLTNSDLSLKTDVYQPYEIDFSAVENINQNAIFKIRLRFESANPEEDEGNRVSFNNLMIEGVSTLSTLEITENETVVKVYPNPTSGMIYIDGFQDEFTYEVFTLQGSKITSGRSNNTGINLASLSQGLYILKVSNQEQNHVQKIFKN